MKNSKTRERYAFFPPPLLFFLLLLSCSKDNPESPDNYIPGPGDLSSVFVTAAPPPLYANLPGDPDTKGFSEVVPLESVLDRDRQRKSVFKGTPIVQIPFSNGYSSQKAYFGKDPGGNPNEAAVTKRFLVISDGDTFVATMVTNYRYWSYNKDFDYLDKPDYTGAVVFSTVSGKLIKVHTYESGLIQEAEFVSSPDSDASYIVVYSAGTKVSGEPAGSYMVSARKKEEESPWLWDSESYPDDPPEKAYSVSLSCDIPNEIQMIGDGVYTAGTKVIIDYIQKYTVKVHKLDYWTGDFMWTKSVRFSHVLSADIESTAYFDTKKPCSNRSKGITNPLISMRIAASNVSMELADSDGNVYANYYGGTFGETRTGKDGNPKRHEGLDLYAEPGTPVYAVCSGTVTKAETNYGDEKVSNSYGNEIRISTTEKNKTFVAQYAHLRSGSPIAVNPRTGRPFKVNDKVFQGDLIGYAGRTGNAVDVPNPHLHFGIQSDGKWIDPKTYINGTYPSSQKSIDKNKGRITDTRCD
jgi:murein DD-endopeptidase MepM/ murein hydrolase activator NlpD